MTREEAIHIIEKDIQIDVRLCSKEDVCRFTEALLVAIAALREQDALIDEIRGMCNLCKHWSNGDGNEVCHNCSWDSAWEWRGVQPEVEG